MPIAWSWKLSKINQTINWYILMSNKIMTLYCKQWLKSSLFSSQCTEVLREQLVQLPAHCLRQNAGFSTDARSVRPCLAIPLYRMLSNLYISRMALNSLATCNDSSLLFLREVSLHIGILKKKVKLATNAIQVGGNETLKNL